MPIQSFYRVTRSQAAELQELENSKLLLNKQPLNKISFPLKKLDNAYENPKDVLTTKTKHLNQSSKITPVKSVSAKSRRKSILSSKKKKILTPGKASLTSPLIVKEANHIFLQHEIDGVYSVIRKQTGALGGNGAGGAIYGEVTKNSFQKVINYLKDNCEFGPESTFLDIGSGLGKPNFHAAVDPGVKISYGVELETLRWELSLHNLKSVIQSKYQSNKVNRCIFTPGDITEAYTLNPFTHIYSFDVGFPPSVMDSLAGIFNRSTAKYMVSFHHPKKIVDCYGFNVELMEKISTSMSGSSEGHTCYVFKRLLDGGNQDNYKDVDPIFKNGIDILKQGNEAVLTWIQLNDRSCTSTGRTRRQKRNAKPASNADINQMFLTQFFEVEGQ